MGDAARDFGRGQDGEVGASPQRAITTEPTPATGKRTAARRVFGENSAQCSFQIGSEGNKSRLRERQISLNHCPAFFFSIPCPHWPSLALYGNKRNLPSANATPAAPPPGLFAEPGPPCGWPFAS